MVCWPFAPDGKGRRLAPLLLLACLVHPLVHAESDSGSAWERSSWLNIGAGYESESRVDPDLNRAVVPGGSFLNFTPSASLTRAIGSRSSLAFSAAASLEKFIDGDGRLFIGLSGLGELTLRSRGKFYGRVALGGEYFDDSEIDAARRSGAGAYGSLGWGGSRSAMEIRLGARQRLYSDLIVEDDAGIPGSYDETTTSIGAVAFGLAGNSSLLRGEISLLSTDARDPLFDSTSWYLRGDARLARGEKWTTWASGLYQRREFDQRAAGEDVDDYLRIGLRLDRVLGGRRSLSVQYAYAVYGEPGGEEDDTHRVALFFTNRFGNRAGRGLQPIFEAIPAAETNAAIQEEGVLFRIRAEGAVVVSVIGDFNGWDRQRHSLRDVGNGWWEITLPIEPGRHQYAFVIDNEIITPPLAEITVDDGFGGRNGLLVVPER